MNTSNARPKHKLFWGVIVFFVVGFLILTGARQQAQDTGTDQPQKGWVLYNYGATVVRIQPTTGATQMLRQYAGGTYAYWQDIGQERDWQNYAYHRLINGPFSDHLVFSIQVDRPIKTEGLQLGEAFIDPGLGLKPGDIVLSVDSKPTTDRNALCRLLVTASSTGMVMLAIIRNGNLIDLRCWPRSMDIE